MTKVQAPSFEFQEFHTPVLLKEVIALLNLKKGGHVMDATINGGGHSMAILNVIGPKGKILGIDRDPVLVHVLMEELHRRGITNVDVVCDTYANLDAVAKRRKFGRVRGVVFDLGFSSFHPDRSGRGFSFQKDEPLDMRYNPTSGPTAADIINESTREELEGIIREFGEERFSRRIAEAITIARRKSRVLTTNDLKCAIEGAVPKWYQHRKIHCATKTFQAFRIAVNGELKALKEGVSRAIDIVEPHGRVAVISFHSLEDGLVKRLFRDLSKQGVVTLVTKKPEVPSREEIRQNPRARSAKLRVVEKIK